MNEETIDNNNTTPDPYSPDERAVLNAAIKMHEIAILHRLYKRNGGRYRTTKAAEEAAKAVLAGLKSSEGKPQSVLRRAVVFTAKNPDAADCSVKATVSSCENLKRQTWKKIRHEDLSRDDIDSLNDNSRIFSLYRTTLKMSQAINDLSKEGTVSKVAHASGQLADRASRELAAPTEAEAA